MEGFTLMRIGSPSWTRTSDPMINSHLLYQLSYRGSIDGLTITLIDPAVKRPGTRFRYTGNDDCKSGKGCLQSVQCFLEGLITGGE